MIRGHDAIVVGAGPSGSATSAILSAAGLKVLLIDRAAFPREKACGEYTSPETEHVLARIGALEPVLQAGARRLPEMRVISPSGHSFSMDFDAGMGPGARVLATSRSVLDSTLLDVARRRGVEVRERTRVTSVIEEGGKVRGVTIDQKTGSSEIRAPIVVGADGVHSAIVRSLGLSRPVRWPQNLGMVARFRNYCGLNDWGEMHVSKSGYVGLAPLSDGLLNVGVVLPMRGAGRLGSGPASERFENFANSFLGVREVLRGASPVTAVRGVGPIGSRTARSSGPGYMLVGDAAGFFDPFTGEGVYRALRSAELAAKVAVTAFESGDFTAESLGRYTRLRSREFLAKDMVCRLVQLFVTWPAAMDYVVKRLNRRPGPRATMTGVLGDQVDPRAALTPHYLWSLLRP